MVKEESDSNSSFLRAARAGNLEKVLEYLKGTIDINTSNANGLNALHLAAKEGHVSVVSELLKRGAKVDAATKKGNTALHIASLAGQEEVVKILIQNGANVNAQATTGGFTPLYMAAQENHVEVVKCLLANGANQTITTDDGFTPLAVALQQGHDKVVAGLLENDTRSKVKLPALHIAAKKDDVKAATLLLQSEHGVDEQSKSGFTPLHIASHYGNVNVGQLLIDNGADINFKARNQITPLHVASKWGKMNMVILLLNAGAKIDCQTRDGLTPLHCAARSGHDQVVDLLLERGALVDCKTKNQLTPLHMAAQGDHVDCARLLLIHKASIDEVTVDYLTPLHVAAHCGNVRTAKLLLERKCEVNARALNGFTPLHIACKKNRIKVIELLLKYGASIEATTETGLTPLHVAAFMGHMNIVVHLLQNNANPDTPTTRGETALHHAARANQTDIMRVLLRHGAKVDARAREDQTALHIAARLGNVDNVQLLLQHGATVDAQTKDMYTPLHIAAKEGHEEVATVLLDANAKKELCTKKGFTPLHIASKYGQSKVVALLLDRGAEPSVQGRNGLTPLHVATHYSHPQVAVLLLEKGASPHTAAKNGYTPLHIAAKKNQMDIATSLLEYNADPNAESKNGFTPVHLAAEEGHSDMVSLLLEQKAQVNYKAKNGLTAMHLAAQEDKVPVAEVLVKYGSEIEAQTKAGYTPLHTACHFGQINMIRFLLDHHASVEATTKLGYTPLHQAAQQGHVLVINLLLKYGADPNVLSNNGQTPLSIAQRLGYISVVEILKTITTVEARELDQTEKYKVQAPETMQEALDSDSDEEGGDVTMLGDQSFTYMSTEMGDDSIAISPIRDERDFNYLERFSSVGPSGRESFRDSVRDTSLYSERSQPSVDRSTSFKSPSVEMDREVSVFTEPQQYVAPAGPRSEERIQKSTALGTAAPATHDDSRNILYGSYSGASFGSSYDADNVALDRHPIYTGFLVSFMVDARGGAMRGCRHSGVRIIIPPGKCCMPTRVTCKLVKKEKLEIPPPIMEGEALASRLLEMGPSNAKFEGPVIIEVPHFASLRGREREIVIMRCDDGKTWREHPLITTEEAIQEALGGSFEDLETAEDLYHRRITRILTTDFPQYFAIVTRIRQDSSQIGAEGGMISSTVVPQVQAVFPTGALTKKIKVGIQAQPVPADTVSKMFGNRVGVSPIVTVEPRRRKFHQPITLTIPVPQAAQKGMINQYGAVAPTLRLLCSITGGPSPAIWEDITSTSVLKIVNDCVQFETSVSARFWLMDCQNTNEAAAMATDLYQEVIAVPFMSKFVIFAKRHDLQESKVRVFCMTDDKMDKTLENQEHFAEVARSRDVEVLEGTPQYIEMGGNVVPVTKSGDQLYVNFHAFRENRLPLTVRIRDSNREPEGRLAFMRDPKSSRQDSPQTPICTLNITLPEMIQGDFHTEMTSEELRRKYELLRAGGVPDDEILRGELRLTDITDHLQGDWIPLARQLGIGEDKIQQIQNDYAHPNEQGLVMLHIWVQEGGGRASGNELEQALKRIGREDIIQKCLYNVEDVTDDLERAVAKVHLDQGFRDLKDDLGPSAEQSLDPSRDASRDSSVHRALETYTFDEDMIKESESADESGSETGSIVDRERTPQAEERAVPQSSTLPDDQLVPVKDERFGVVTTPSDLELEEHSRKKREAYLQFVLQLDEAPEVPIPGLEEDPALAQGSTVHEAEITPTVTDKQSPNAAQLEELILAMESKPDHGMDDRMSMSSEEELVITRGVPLQGEYIPDDVIKQQLIETRDTITKMTSETVETYHREGKEGDEGSTAEYKEPSDYSSEYTPDQDAFREPSPDDSADRPGVRIYTDTIEDSVERSPFKKIGSFDGEETTPTITITTDDSLPADEDDFVKYYGLESYTQVHQDSELRGGPENPEEASPTEDVHSEIGDRFDTSEHTVSAMKSSSFENLYERAENVKEACDIDDKDIDEGEHMSEVEDAPEKGEGEDEKYYVQSPPQMYMSAGDHRGSIQRSSAGSVHAPIDITLNEGLDRVGQEVNTDMADRHRLQAEDFLSRSHSEDVPMDTDLVERTRHYSTPDEHQGDEAAALDDDDDEMETTKVTMRKQIHKKTVIRDGKEETVVTEDTQVEQDNEGPEELRQNMQAIIDQFMTESPPKYLTDKK